MGKQTIDDQMEPKERAVEDRICTSSETRHLLGDPGSFLNGERSEVGYGREPLEMYIQARTYNIDFTSTPAI
jgi:hypothetical protein